MRVDVRQVATHLLGLSQPWGELCGSGGSSIMMFRDVLLHQREATMQYRRFYLSYIVGGEFIHKYADTIAELERLLLVPRSLGVGWRFKSVC